MTTTKIMFELEYLSLEALRALELAARTEVRDTEASPELTQQDHDVIRARHEQVRAQLVIREGEQSWA